jgi:hypothetical protein
MMIWPWIEDEIENVIEYRGRRNTPVNAGVTAHAFLVFLRHLRTVILQDSAAMMAKYSERGGHVIFEHAVFDSLLFKEFKLKMHEELRKEVMDERVAVEQAMPGVNRQFDEVFNRMDEQKEEILELKTLVRKIDGRAGGLTSLQMLKALNSAAQSLQEDMAQQQQEEEEDELQRDQPGLSGEGGLEEAQGIRLQDRFETVMDMTKCWLGTGRYETIMWPGGIKALEEKFGGKWRQHWSTASKQRFSRFKRVVLAALKNKNVGDYQRAFEERKGLYGAVQYGQEIGQIEVTKRKSKGSPAPTGNGSQ